MEEASEKSNNKLSASFPAVTWSDHSSLFIGGALWPLSLPKRFQERSQQHLTLLETCFFPPSLSLSLSIIIFCFHIFYLLWKWCAQSGWCCGYIRSCAQQQLQGVVYLDINCSSIYSMVVACPFACSADSRVTADRLHVACVTALNNIIEVIDAMKRRLYTQLLRSIIWDFWRSSYPQDNASNDQLLFLILSKRVYNMQMFSWGNPLPLSTPPNRNRPLKTLAFHLRKAQR